MPRIGNSLSEVFNFKGVEVVVHPSTRAGDKEELSCKPTVNLIQPLERGWRMRRDNYSIRGFRLRLHPRLTVFNPDGLVFPKPTVNLIQPQERGWRIWKDNY